MNDELSSHPVKQFVWNISERQFQVIQQDERGNRVLMAESSSMSTFCKCMSDMMAACGKTVEFEVKPMGTVLAARDRRIAELVRAARNMLREWIEVVGGETQNSTPADTLEKLQAAIEAVEKEPR